jgi:hypothetical protein
MKVLIVQWMLQRKAGLPKNFDKFKLITEYVAETEVVQVFSDEVEASKARIYFIWRVEGVVVRVAQLMQMHSDSTGVMTVWSTNKETQEFIKNFAIAALTAEYENDHSMIGYWLDIGDMRMAHYQRLATERWEASQIKKHLSDEATMTYHFGVDWAEDIEADARDSIVGAVNSWFKPKEDFIPPAEDNKAPDNPDESVGKAWDEWGKEDE